MHSGAGLRIYGEGRSASICILSINCISAAPFLVYMPVRLVETTSLLFLRLVFSLNIDWNLAQNRYYEKGDYHYILSVPI